MDAAYVMGDDPERMDAGAVVAAKPVRARGDRAPATPVAGYLYLVLHTQQLPEGRWDVAAQQLRPAGAGPGRRRRRLHDPAGGADHRRP